MRLSLSFPAQPESASIRQVNLVATSAESYKQCLSISSAVHYAVFRSVALSWLLDCRRGGHKRMDVRGTAVHYAVVRFVVLSWCGIVLMCFVTSGPFQFHSLTLSHSPSFSLSLPHSLSLSLPVPVFLSLGEGGGQHLEVPLRCEKKLCRSSDRTYRKVGAAHQC